MEVGEWVSWAAYHVNRIGPPSDIPVKAMILPLFREAANSPRMVYHGTNIVKTTTQYLNPRQTPSGYHLELVLQQTTFPSIQLRSVWVLKSAEDY